MEDARLSHDQLLSARPLGVALPSPPPCESASRDQFALVSGITTDTVSDLVEAVGRNELARLLPARQIHTNGRILKRGVSTYDTRAPG
ncbi:hypothetical protein LRE75_30825 [Streptomyces sp. 372A]